MENLNLPRQEILEILKQLKYCCDEFELYSEDKGEVKIMIGDIDFKNLKRTENLYNIAGYLRKNGVDFSITFDLINDIPDMYIDDQHPSEDFIQLGIIKGKNIEAIKKVIENNIKKLNPQMEAQSPQGMAGSPNVKEVKQKFTSKLRIVDSYLYFGEEKIPVERGQKEMTKLFLDNAKIFRGEKKSSNGHALSIGDIQRAGNYTNDCSFRNGLNKLRKKLKKAKCHSSPLLRAV